jgi:hypothetical protein
VAAWISNYYLSKNRISVVKFRWALHKYASGQHVLNWCYQSKYVCFRPFPPWQSLYPSPCKCHEVCTSTGCTTGDWCSILGRGKDISLLPKVQRDIGAHPTSCSVSTGGKFPWGGKINDSPSNSIETTCLWFDA